MARYLVTWKHKYNSDSGEKVIEAIGSLDALQEAWFALAAKTKGGEEPEGTVSVTRFPAKESLDRTL